MALVISIFLAILLAGSVYRLMLCKKKFARLEQAYEYAVLEHDFEEYEKSRG